MANTINGSGSEIVHGDASGFLNSLDSIREDLRTQISVLRDINETMTTCGWKGNTSNTFNSNIDSYETSLNSLANQLDSIREQIASADATVDSVYGDLSTGA